MTDPQHRGDDDEGRVPAPDGFLRELIAHAAQLIEESGQAARPDDYETRRARFLEIAEAVRANS